MERGTSPIKTIYGSGHSSQQSWSLFISFEDFTKQISVSIDSTAHGYSLGTAFSSKAPYLLIYL